MIIADTPSARLLFEIKSGCPLDPSLCDDKERHLLEVLHFEEKVMVDGEGFYVSFKTKEK